MGPFVGWDDHIVRVVNRNGNACRQARVHWLLASLVYFKKRVGVLENLWISYSCICYKLEMEKHPRNPHPKPPFPHHRLGQQLGGKGNHWTLSHQLIQQGSFSFCRSAKKLNTNHMAKIRSPMKTTASRQSKS